jgi:hypothetical protein
MEYWVHPSGYEIWEMRDQKVTITQPPTDDCTELRDATLAILRDTIATETAVKEHLEGEKSRLEKMNKTTDDYCRQYDGYIQSLRAMKAQVDTVVDDIETMRQQLVEMKCPVDIIDGKLQELADLQTWADIELSPMSTQFLECTKIPPPINLPEEE